MPIISRAPTEARTGKFAAPYTSSRTAWPLRCTSRCTSWKSQSAALFARPPNTAINERMIDLDFVAWALSGERTLEEAFCAELLVEFGLQAWRKKCGHAEPPDLDALRERQCRRRLNPAHRAKLNEVDTRLAAQMLLVLSEINHWTAVEDRPLRNLSGLRFCPQLRKLMLSPTEVVDLLPLQMLPKLEELWIQDEMLEDFSALAGCKRLRKVHLWPGFPWCNLQALAALPELEELVFHGNLPMLEGVGPLPRLTKALLCAAGPGQAPLRNAWMLPHMPSLRYAHFDSLSRLDGLGRFPAIEELAISGQYRDLTPLAELTGLRKLILGGENYLDVSSLSRLPQLSTLRFLREYPLDYLPLIHAPKLRQISTSPEDMAGVELDGVNAALGGWAVEFALAEPRPLEPAVFRIVDMGPFAQPEFTPRTGVRVVASAESIEEAEGQWLSQRVDDAIVKALKDENWGEVDSCPFAAKRCEIEIRVYRVQAAERLREIVEACRLVLAGLNNRWTIDLSVMLEPDCQPTPPLWTDPVQMELEERIARAHAAAQRRREYLGYLERLHQFQLRQGFGEGLSPEEFAAPQPQEPPVKVTNKALKRERERHPLADVYFLMGDITEDGFWVYKGYRDAAERLLGGPLEEPVGMSEDEY